MFLKKILSIENETKNISSIKNKTKEQFPSLKSLFIVFTTKLEDEK